VVAQAFRIDATPAGVVFTFQSNQKVPKAQCEDQKTWLQGMVEKVAGKPIPVTITIAEGVAPSASAKATAGPTSAQTKQPTLGDDDDPMKNSTVQAVLEIFPIEKTTVEER
jgi:hypothetical protein